MPTELTTLNFEQTLIGITDLLPLATQQINHIDLLRNFLTSPNDLSFIRSAQWPALSSSTSNESRLLDVPLSEFSDRLGQVIKAFLFGSFTNSTKYLTSSAVLPNNTFGHAQLQTNLLSSIQNLSTTLSASGNVTLAEEVYICHYHWLIPFLKSALAILFSAIAAAIFSRLTKTRDYLGYISSVVLESQYTGEPK